MEMPVHQFAFIRSSPGGVMSVHLPGSSAGASLGRPSPDFAQREGTKSGSPPPTPMPLDPDAPAVTMPPVPALPPVPLEPPVPAVSPGLTASRPEPHPKTKSKSDSERFGMDLS